MKTHILSFLTFFMLSFSYSGFAQCNNDWNALHNLYNSTDGSNWANNTGWASVAANPFPPGACDLSGLFGITINGSGRVTHIQLGNNSLMGSIPSQLGNLTQLEVLNLGNLAVAGTPNKNNLVGSIPGTLNNCFKLRILNLRGNQLGGSIPGLSNLTDLESFVLSSNNLGGGIPGFIGGLTNLLTIDIGYNPLGGTIPSNLGNCTKLRTLDLSNAQLSGLLPPQIGDCDSLVVFWLRDNVNLSGPIPVEYESFPILKSVRWNNNAFTGALPKLTMSTQLEVLAISQNQFDGPLESGYGSFSQLLELAMAFNQLEGAIPASWNNFPNLRNLNIGNNQLTGILPTAFGSFSELRYFTVQNNPGLLGALPSAFSAWTELLEFKAGKCDFSGSIPTSYAAWAKCRLLDVGGNSLSGNAPDIFGGMADLRYVAFDNNNFSGNMPSSLALPDSIVELYIHENGLSGCFDPALDHLCSTLVTYNIDSGNSFDASWNNFCAGAGGACITINPTSCTFSNGLSVNQEVEGNVCVTGMINISEAVLLTPQVSQPTSPEAGTMYFDANTAKLRVWDGSQWRDCW